MRHGTWVLGRIVLSNVVDASYDSQRQTGGMMQMIMGLKPINLLYLGI